MIRLATSLQELAREARDSQTEELTPSRLANLDDEKVRQDVLTLSQNQIQMFLNVIDSEPDTSPFLGSLNYTRNRDEYEIDIRELINNIAVSRNPLFEEVIERDVDLSIDLDTQVNNGDIMPVLLNGDSLDDIFVFTHYDSSNINGILLLSQ